MNLQSWARVNRASEHHPTIEKLLRTHEIFLEGLELFPGMALIKVKDTLSATDEDDPVRRKNPTYWSVRHREMTRFHLRRKNPGLGFLLHDAEFMEASSSMNLKELLADPESRKILQECLTLEILMERYPLEMILVNPLFQDLHPSTSPPKKSQEPLELDFDF